MCRKNGLTAGFGGAILVQSQMGLKGMGSLDKETQKLHDDVNRAIVECRDVYAQWSKRHGISYNKMLVYYTIREYGFCTQKMICDHYLLPRQTIHNVFLSMRSDGILAECADKGRGKEKVFELTEKGRAEAETLLKSIGQVEERAARQMGAERIREMTALFREYDCVLRRALEADV